MRNEPLPFPPPKLACSTKVKPEYWAALLVSGMCYLIFQINGRLSAGLWMIFLGIWVVDDVQKSGVLNPYGHLAKEKDLKRQKYQTTAAIIAWIIAILPLP